MPKINFAAKIVRSLLGIRTHEPDCATTAYALIDDKNNPVAFGSLRFNARTASYTLTLEDNGKCVQMGSGSAQNLTVPLNASVPFPIGAQIVISNAGAGLTTVVATGGVTINTSRTLVLRAQHSMAALVKTGINTWTLSGDLTAA